MNNQAKQILSENNISLELKDFKEKRKNRVLNTSGIICVNGIEAISFKSIEDEEFTYEIINKKESKKLLSLMPKLSDISITVEGIDYGESYYFEMEYDFENLCFDLGNDIKNTKYLKKLCKKNTLIRYINEDYEDSESVVYKYTLNKSLVEFIGTVITKRKQSSVFIYNIDEEWKEYTISELLKKVA